MTEVLQAQTEEAPPAPDRFPPRIMEALRGRGWEEGEINWMDPAQAFREVMIWELGHVEWANSVVELIQGLGGKVVWNAAKEEELHRISMRQFATNLGYDPIEQWPQRKPISAVYQRTIKDSMSPGRRKLIEIGEELVVVANEKKYQNVQWYWFCILARGKAWISFDIRTLPQFSAEESALWDDQFLITKDKERLDRVAEIIKANPDLIDQLIQVAEAAS